MPSGFSKSEWPYKVRVALQKGGTFQSGFTKRGDPGVGVAAEAPERLELLDVHARLALPREIIFIELMTSDRKLKASIEGSK